MTMKTSKEWAERILEVQAKQWPTVKATLAMVLTGEDPPHDVKQLVVDRAIKVLAAEVEAIRAEIPHPFRGRLDRWCELCNRPDRHPTHQRTPDRDTATV